MQKLITEKCNIFESNGEVMQAGYACSPVFKNNADKSSTYGKHSEYKSYFVSNDEVALYILIENLPKTANVKIAVADLKRGGIISDFCTKHYFFVKNSYCFDNIKNDYIFEDEKIQLRIMSTSDGIYIKCDFIDFNGSKNLYVNLNLSPISSDGLYQLAPFERNRRYFYYKQFEPKYSANGVIHVGGIEYKIEGDSTNAYVDTMRFSKPRPHNYQRLSACTKIGDINFALCLASRVGDNRYGNENCFFIDGKLEKLSQINVKGTSGRLDRPWYFSAGISAVDITFKPFTIKKEPFCAVMDKTTIIFGRLYGELKRVDYEMPFVLDNALAHMIFAEI